MPLNVERVVDHTRQRGEERHQLRPVLSVPVQLPDPGIQSQQKETLVALTRKQETLKLRPRLDPLLLCPRGQRALLQRAKVKLRGRGLCPRDKDRVDLVIVLLLRVA